MFGTYRWLAGVLLGESTAAAGEADSVDKYAGNLGALFLAHLNQANAAAIFGDQAALERHTAAAMPLAPVFPGLYSTAVARLLRGLALAGQARSADAGHRGALLAELDEVTRWLAARAADAPENFLHLLRLLEAERAWTTGDFRAAALAFDAARREVAPRQRPWHRALIAEHAARFYLAHGLEQAGHDLLTQVRQEYLTWGATAKVAQLDWAYPVRRPPSDAAATAGEQSGDRPHRRAAVPAAGSPATRTSPVLTAARCWPCPSSAAARCGRCCSWRTAFSAGHSPPNVWTPSSSSPGSLPSPSRTPGCTPSSAGSPASRRRCGGWRRWSPRGRGRSRCSPRWPRRPGGCWSRTSRSWSGTTTRRRRSRLWARGPAPARQRRPRSAVSCRSAGRT